MLTIIRIRTHNNNTYDNLEAYLDEYTNFCAES